MLTRRAVTTLLAGVAATPGTLGPPIRTPAQSSTMLSDPISRAGKPTPAMPRSHARAV